MIRLFVVEDYTPEEEQELRSGLIPLFEQYADIEVSVWKILHEAQPYQARMWDGPYYNTMRDGPWYKFEYMGGASSIETLIQSLHARMEQEQKNV